MSSFFIHKTFLFYDHIKIISLCFNTNLLFLPTAFGRHFYFISENSFDESTSLKSSGDDSDNHFLMFSYKPIPLVILCTTLLRFIFAFCKQSSLKYTKEFCRRFIKQECVRVDDQLRVLNTRNFILLSNCERIISSCRWISEWTFDPASMIKFWLEYEYYSF